MSRHQAAQVSLPEFHLRRKGWERMETREWEKIRWIVFHEYQLSPYVKPLSKPKRPSQILHLPGDIEPLDNVTRDDCHPSIEEMDKLNELFASIRAKRVNIN